MKRPWIVIAGVLSLVSLMTLGLTVISPSAASAALAPIHIAGTDGDGVLMHPDPNTSGPAVGLIPEGASPDYQCFEYGQVVNGVPIWFRVAYNGITGYYTSAYDDSRYQSDAELTDNYGVPRCGADAAVLRDGQDGPQPSPSQPEVPVAGFYSPFDPAQRGDDGQLEDLIDQSSIYTSNSSVWYTCADASDEPYFALHGQLAAGEYLDRVGGWSLGRLGPPYLIRGMQKYDPNLLRSLNYIILIDPGDYSDLHPCDINADAGGSYATWLKYNTHARLVILSGTSTQREDSKGIQEVYFNPIRDQAVGTDIRNRVLVCNYSVDHYSIYHAGQYWVKHEIEDTCPVLNYSGTRWNPVAWHP